MEYIYPVFRYAYNANIIPAPIKTYIKQLPMQNVIK